MPHGAATMRPPNASKQAQIQAAANQSPQVQQLRSFQAAANSSPQVQGLMQLQKAADGNATSKDSSQNASPESQFRADPQAFLAHNGVLTDMKQGLVDSGIPSNVAGAFCKTMNRFSKHWFRLTPDKMSSKPQRAAYNLTPAVDKYLDAFPEDTDLSQILADVSLPSGDCIPSAFIDYKQISPNNFDQDVGHANLYGSRSSDADFNPDFAFTPAMTGCGLAITHPNKDTGPQIQNTRPPAFGPDDDNGNNVPPPSHAPSTVSNSNSDKGDQQFTAWHFQNPGDNIAHSSDFRTSRNVTDWFGIEEYEKGGDKESGMPHIATNFLHRDGNDQWNILSQYNKQEMDGSFTTMDNKMRKADMHGSDAGRFQYLKEIYLGVAKDAWRINSSSLSSLERLLPLLPSSIQSFTKQLLDFYKGTYDYEIATLRSVDSLDALRKTAESILSTRERNFASMAAFQESILSKCEQEGKKPKGLFASLLEGKKSKNDTGNNASSNPYAGSGSSGGKSSSGSPKQDALQSVVSKVPLLLKSFENTDWIKAMLNEARN